MLTETLLIIPFAVTVYLSMAAGKSAQELSVLGGFQYDFTES
jgi:hypothetical protein